MKSLNVYKNFSYFNDINNNNVFKMQLKKLKSVRIHCKHLLSWEKIKSLLKKHEYSPQYWEKDYN